MTCHTFMAAIQSAKTVEDFICAIADVTDFEQDNRDFVGIAAHWQAAISKAREFQRPMDHSIGKLLGSLTDISNLRADALGSARDVATRAILEHGSISI